MTKSWYVKHRADRKTKHFTKSCLRCNRTGTFVSKSTGKRAMKSQGSSKTGCSCPAFITTIRYHATGEVQAEFCLRHVGHRQENAFNRMSKEMPTTIAAKLSQGISMTSVMDYMRDSMCGPLNRDHLITSADLHNIKQQYSQSVTQTLRQGGSTTGGAWSPPNFFRPYRTQFGPKIRGGTPGPSPRSATDLKCAEQELNRAFIVNIGQMSHGILASSYWHLIRLTFSSKHSRSFCLALYWLCHWSQNLICKARGDGVKRTRQYKLLMNAMINYWVPVVILLL